ncbi:glyoxalase [Glycomyces tenuis]|uniref:glyoxalase n=2 Tax=Glycomyces tenuis TaxID=58116 RepID=UPI00047CBC61|nr:glyoxalase [Glycomyces tenuis]
MTSIKTITLETADIAAARTFYDTAFGLGDRLALRESEAPTSGFRGFTLSLIVSQPAGVHRLYDAAMDAGAESIKPVTKSMWGHGSVLRAPDGTVWQVATSAKKDTGPDSGEIDDIVLLLGVSDMKASKQFYVDHGLAVEKSYGSKYIEFASRPGEVTLAMYKRKGLAKTVGVDAEGGGSHRLVVGGDTEPFADPDGFEWETAANAG